MPEDLDSLYLITDRNAPAGGDLLGALRAALRGGVRFLQFREKDLPARARYELGRDVVRLAGEFGARVIVNGDPALALALGAAGVHLRKDTLPAGVVRERLGFAGLIGYSAHSGAEAAEAFSAGADFATLSPVFPSRSKSVALPLLGIEGFQREICDLEGPVFALGGVDAGRAPGCIAAGARGVALIGAILAAADPAAAAARLRAALGG